MANFIPKIGQHANLPSVQDGSLLITTDNKEIYVDTATGRQLISDGRREIEYIEGTQSSATNDWTGVTTDSSLYVGKVIAYKLPYEGTASAANLTLTYAAGGTTSAIPLRRQNAIVTRHYPAESVILLIYDGTYWRTDGDYNSEPVSSVNQKTGHVILNASDVGALADDTFIPTKTSDLTNDAGFITQADVVHQSFNGANGIEVTSSGIIQHTNTVTSVTSYPLGTSAHADGGAINVRDYLYDAQGHITGSQERTIMLSQSQPTLDDLGAIGTITTGTVTAPLSISVTQSGSTATIEGSINVATTTAAGVVQLSSATNSNSNDFAATPGAVKTAYDLANSYRGTVTSITPGAGLVNGNTNDNTAITSTGTLSLATISSSNSTSQATPGSQGSFTVIDDISVNNFGQVTGINTKTVTLPAGAVYEFADTYNASTNKGATVATVTNAINALTVSAITGTASKTITSISETSGKISATYTDISIAPSQINSAIPNSKLENSTISIAGTSVALGSSISAETLRANLSLSQALAFKGITSAAIADGNNVIPTDLGISNYSPSVGDVVIDSATSKEFVWIKGDGFLTGRWEQLGPDNSYKVLQDAISSPTTSGAATEFIDTISQNANGVITATKKYIPSATTTAAGLMTSAMVTKLNNIPANATTNSGTVTSITLTAGTGIAIDSSAAITTSGSRTISLDTTGTSGTYGNTSQQTPSHGNTFNIPYFTTDEYGRVTSAGTTTVKLPTDEKGVTSIAITAGTGLTVNSTAAITTSGSREVSLAQLASTGNTSSTATPGFGDTFTAIDTISYDAYGRTSSTNIKTITIPNATASTTSNGLMTSSMVTQINSMKSKLDNIDANANNYTLPTASATVKGGVKVGSGLTMSGEVLNHSNSITSGTVKGDDNKTLTYGGTFTIPSITYDAQGHITNVGTTTMTMPADTNVNTWQPLSTAQDGYVEQAPDDTDKFLRGDATWANVTKENVGLGNVANIDQSKAITSITRSGTTFTYTTLDGTTGTFTQQDNNSDTKVTQAAAITTSGDYPIILAYSTATTSITNTVNKTSTLTYNPGTKVLSITGGTISASTFSGTATKVGHKLTIGSYEFDGSADVSIPIYGGEISNTVNYVNGDNLAYGGN